MACRLAASDGSEEASSSWRSSQGALLSGLSMFCRLRVPFDCEEIVLTPPPFAHPGQSSAEAFSAGAYACMGHIRLFLPRF